MKESLFCVGNIMYSVYVLFHILYIYIYINKKCCVFSSMNQVANVVSIIWTVYSSIELFGAVSHSAVKKIKKFFQKWTVKFNNPWIIHYHCDIKVALSMFTITGTTTAVFFSKNSFTLCISFVKHTFVLIYKVNTRYVFVYGTYRSCSSRLHVNVLISISDSVCLRRGLEVERETVWECWLCWVTVHTGQ